MRFQNPLLQFLTGPDRKLRFIWRATIFWVITAYALPSLITPLVMRTTAWLRVDDALSAASLALWEFSLFVIALIGTAVLSLYERRSVDSYGLPIRQVLSSNTAEGVLVGVAMTGFVAGGMLLLGGMQVHGIATKGRECIFSALAWLGANIIVGVAEESMYRGYFLQALWRSIGFWPASIVITLLFTADHYFYKTGENIWDVITLMSLSLFTCYSVLRTGTLWFAVGFHGAFDYMQLFVIGTPNGDQLPVGRLLNVTFQGPTWLTGGVLGTEASCLMYPAIVIGWVYVWWRFREDRYSPEVEAARLRLVAKNE
jgi:membrane protease YdiL (CAAX protease family)